MELSRRTTRASLSKESKKLPKRKVKKTKFDQAKAEDSGFIEEEIIEQLAFSSRTPSYILKPRHPLVSTWTFWFSAGNKKLSWTQNQIKIATVSTVEDFWFVFNQAVQPPSSVPAGYTYSVFRGDILPDWEHIDNRDGGRWMASFAKSQRLDLLDSRWLEILIMLMGEHVGEIGSNMITGAEVCVRKRGDRLEVWMGEADMGTVVQVGREVRKRLYLESNEKIQFSIHKEEMEGSVGSSLAL